MDTVNGHCQLFDYIHIDSLKKKNCTEVTFRKSMCFPSFLHTGKYTYAVGGFRRIAPSNALLCNEHNSTSFIVSDVNTSRGE